MLVSFCIHACGEVLDGRGDMEQFYIIMSTIGAFQAMDFVYSGEFQHSGSNYSSLLWERERNGVQRGNGIRLGVSMFNEESFVRADRWRAWFHTGHLRYETRRSFSTLAPYSHRHSDAFPGNPGTLKSLRRGFG